MRQSEKRKELGSDPLEHGEASLGVVSLGKAWRFKNEGGG